MKQIETKILANDHIAKDFYYMELDWQEGEAPQSGQFFNLRVSNSTAPLLRRPFAFSSYHEEKKIISYIYQKRGPATEILMEKRVGDSVNVLGPIGNSFNSKPKKKKVIVIAGGVGVGPMLFTTENLKNRNREVLFVFGSRDSSFVPDHQLFYSAEPVICTDDGSAGFKGTTVDYLRTLENKELEDAVIYTCGPHPMQKACHEFSLEKNLQCYVSMEEIMACGVGACMGCVIKTVKSGFTRVCKEGPVYNSRELLWT